MKNKDYWKSRAVDLEALMQTNTNQTMIKINEIYQKASDSITRKVNKIFTRYVSGGKLTPEYAKQLLNEKQTAEQRAELKKLLAETKDEKLRREIINTLDAPAYGARISRLEALRDNLYYEAKAIGAKEVELAESRLVNVYEQSYYRTIYADQASNGIYDFDIITDEKIKAMLAHDWQGGNYSSRLWNNNEEFAQKVASTIETGCLAGWTLDEMCSELKSHVIGDNPDRAQRYITSRLIRTEVNYFSNQGTIEGLKAAGFTKYRFIATLDLRTSEMCRKLDMKVFDIDDAVPGVNLPPLHPFCRSVIVPAYENENRAGRTRWARNPVTGKGMKVPADMSYDDWYKKYVEKSLNDTIKMRGTGKASNENCKTIHKIIGTVNRNDKELIEKEYIQPFIEKYVKSDYEHMLVVDKNGTVHYITSNSKNLVDLSSVDIDFEDSYNIHTHPPNQTQFSFSDDADIPAMFEDKTVVMEACDYKYRYRFERVDITFDEWEKVRSEVEDELTKVLTKKGYNFENYEEQAKHVLIEETCKRLGLNCYRRWKI